MTSTSTKPALRADARLSREKILAAAADCLGSNPQASTRDIAQAAGVGRVTLYGHFPSREELVEATMSRLLALGEEVLSEVDLAGDPRVALQGLITAGWQLMAQAGGVLQAAQATLPPDRVREMHAEPERRIDDLIRRGQVEGFFRTDLPAAWLAGVLHHVMKGAASDVSAGRLNSSDAGPFIGATILAAYSSATLIN